jgi:hypothetical protein
LLPAMTLADEQLDEGCDILAEVLRAWSTEHGAGSA